MDASAINSKFSHLTFPYPHRKYMHLNKIMSFTPFMSLKPSAHKVLEVTNVPKITCYHDTWLDLMAINHLSQNLQAVAGIQIEEKGYDGLLETCKVVTVKFDPMQQRQLSLEGLARSIPKKIIPLLKALVPHCKFTRELLAKFTGLFFAWLVGPCELKESEFNGTREKNVVHVKKCRFLESSNCVGMCTNLCKFPTQTFIKDSLGMPITMVPSEHLETLIALQPVNLPSVMIITNQLTVDPTTIYRLFNHKNDFRSTRKLWELVKSIRGTPLKGAPNMIPCYHHGRDTYEPACYDAKGSLFDPNTKSPRTLAQLCIMKTMIRIWT